jgi:AraC-like DNA-binding protein
MPFLTPLMEELAMAPAALQHAERVPLSNGHRPSSPSTMTTRARHPRRRTFTHAHRQRLDRAAEHYLRDCYRRATRATVTEFAAILGCHPDYLTRTAASILGASLLDYLRAKQLEEAERLITVTTLGMKEIALRAGFGTVSTFYRHFREAHGMSPGAFRKVRK